MTVPLSIADAARSIIADPSPVVLLDTCAILDLLRAPKRREIQNAVLSAGHEILAQSAPPQRIWWVTTTLVIVEWQAHVAEVEAELVSHIHDLERALADFHDAADLVAPSHALHRQQLVSLNLPTRLRQMAQEIVDRSFVLAENHDCRMRAGARVIQGIPPSGKGKQQFKDCEILEHYLALCGALRAGGLSGKIVFVSSNKKDYLEAINLHPALHADFAAVGLDYAGDLAWAMAEIRRAPMP